MARACIMLPAWLPDREDMLLAAVTLNAALARRLDVLGSRLARIPELREAVCSYHGPAALYEPQDLRGLGLYDGIPSGDSEDTFDDYIGMFEDLGPIIDPLVLDRPVPPGVPDVLWHEMTTTFRCWPGCTARLQFNFIEHLGNCAEDGDRVYSTDPLTLPGRGQAERLFETLRQRRVWPQARGDRGPA